MNEGTWREAILWCPECSHPLLISSIITTAYFSDDFQCSRPSSSAGYIQLQVFFVTAGYAQLQVFVFIDGSDYPQVFFVADGPAQPPILSSAK